MKNILLIIIGYVLIYAALESTAHITGDTVKTENALIICACTVLVSVLIEIILFKENLYKSIIKLGLGKPDVKSVLVAVLISILLFCCYPIITLVTGYKFIMPDNWLWLSLGVFALHGIAEEVAYRGFLFHHLRQGRSFQKAAWLSVLFFSVAHLPIIATQGIIVGGAAMLLAIASSFPFAYMFEKGNNTIWAPALVHFAVDTVIPILAYDNSTDSNRQTAILLWMIAGIILPYLAFVLLRKKTIN